VYELTDEGREYLNNGLPEKQLLDFIGNEKSLEEVSKFPKSQIAIGWAKKNGWIIIENKTVKLTEEGKKASKEKVYTEICLEKVNRRDIVEPEMIKILLSRSLIREAKVPIVEIKKERKTSIWQKILKIFSKKKVEAKEETKSETKPSITNGEIAQLNPDLIKTGEWRNIPFRKYDVNAPAPKLYPGKKQPYIQVMEMVREKLIGLGFQEMKGPLIETSFWNDDALFMPQDHPARGIHDVLFLKNPTTGSLPDENLVAKVKATHEGGWVTESTGWGNVWSKEEASKLLMRSQGTAVSARTLYENKDKPAKYFMIDRNFRYDIIDAQHLMEFDHCEGIVIGENMTFRHLLGFLKEIAELFGAEKIKFKPGYFPFTSPSCELYVYYDRLGWIEAGGAGMMRPEVLRPLGLEKSQVLAWGLGIGRLAMIALGIADIRMLYSDDLKWLREKETVII
jgi:phenylalanyl-tRNA synthetase alpha chain